MVAYDVTFEFRLTSRSVEVKVAVVKHEGVARGGGGRPPPGRAGGVTKWSQIHPLRKRKLAKHRTHVQILAHLVPPSPAPIIYC